MLTTRFLFLPIVLLVLFISIFVVNKIIKIEVPDVKYPAIDGVRGFLAFFVFLHHCSIWYVFLKTKEWKEPESNLFNHFGQTSVALFFMITAFLFLNKLINAKDKTINWNLYIKSRFLRLFPAYFFSICIVFATVIYLSNFEIKDSFLANFKNSIGWIFFTIGGPNDINTIKNTYLIDAGVSWSLPYEWLFYLILPILALLFKIHVSTKNIVLYSLFFIAIALINHVKLEQFFPFLGGIIAALICSKTKLKFHKIEYTLVLILLLFVLIYFFNSGKNIISLLISTLIFILIAGGNSIFGILTNTFSRLLGQQTYSLYLLHGIVLFLVFNFGIGYEKASKLSEINYWIIIFSCIFPILLISQISYKYIELPFLNSQKIKS